MKPLRVMLLCLTALVASGCTGDHAQELFETAQLEEKQNNQAHARELYEQILKQYPNSEVAKKAGERLSRLQGKEPSMPAEGRP